MYKNIYKQITDIFYHRLNEYLYRDTMFGTRTDSASYALSLVDAIREQTFQIQDLISAKYRTDYIAEHTEKDI